MSDLPSPTAEQREAIASRLDTRCVTWTFMRTGRERRCNSCDGCVAARWLAGAGATVQAGHRS